MILTKETYAIHLICLALAIPTLIAIERISPSSSLPPGAGTWTKYDFDRALLVSVLLIFFFYTGGLMDWSSLRGLIETYARWLQTGTGGTSGHEKSWNYFVDLISGYEWPALLGMAATAGLAARGANRFARYLAIYGFGSLTAYSIIAYKTPWCVIVLIWPFLILFGLAVDRLLDWLDRWVIAGFASLIFAYSLAATAQLNFSNYCEEDEPYAYVQTLPDIHRLLDPLRDLARQDPANYQLPGIVMAAEHHPLHWLLGKFTQVHFFHPDKAKQPEEWDAAFLVVDETVAPKAESMLTESYFREPIRLRGNATDSEMLYLNAATFGAYFPGRLPEYIPSSQ
jgi:hypothetical protein